MQRAAGLRRGSDDGGRAVYRRDGRGSLRAAAKDTAQLSGDGFDNAKLGSGDWSHKQPQRQSYSGGLLPEGRDSGEHSGLQGGMQLFFPGLLYRRVDHGRREYIGTISCSGVSDSEASGVGSAKVDRSH